jgi:hypothetical protein
LSDALIWIFVLNPHSKIRDPPSKKPQLNNMTSITPKAPNYDEEVDFQALAMIDSDFAKFYDDANGHVDFQDPKALQQAIVHLDCLQHSTD